MPDMAGLGTTALLLVAFLIPGAVFVWSFERPAGRYGIGLKDRALRLMAASSVLLTLFARPIYVTYINYWDDILNRQPLPDRLWLFPLLYFSIPWAAGSLLGWGWKNEWPGVRQLLGRNRAPSAWDHVFQDRTTAGVRCKLKTGTWIAGIYDHEKGRSQPYASGHPDPPDLFLPTMVWTDSDTGEIFTDDSGLPIEFDVGVLLRWEDIEFLEFQELTGGHRWPVNDDKQGKKNTHIPNTEEATRPTRKQTPQDLNFPSRPAGNARPPRRPKNKSESK